MKLIEFLGSSQQDLRDMPSNVRYALALELMTLQCDEASSEHKSLPEVGAHAYEICFHDTVNGAFRVVCIAQFTHTIYVLHAFQRKTLRAAQDDVDLAAKRYEMIEGE
ncbi:MAG: type II toxin-antitoxin system RelE/ParE family toxin [Comamonas sp.]|nr:type II toxin-antitoxin system RelE/ParE family toxin [Comamonas sp.]